MLSFRNFFSCCSAGESSKKPVDNDEIDETSRLIPDSVTEQPQSTPALVYVDQERLRERLGTIVRAKEGKMVNVIKKSHLRSRTHFDTLGPVSGRMTSTLPPQNRLPVDSESEDGFSTQEEDRLAVDNGPPRGNSPSPSAQDIFNPQQNVKLSLSWED